MKLDQIEQHWQDWATHYGQDLRATTKTWTIKALEIDALARKIKTLPVARQKFTVLEAGCGNGANCLGLSRIFPEARFDGFDYVADMVESAKELCVKEKNLRFVTGNILETASIKEIEPEYDVVFTDRCIINMNTPELQKQAISSLAAKVRKGGHLLMIENAQSTYDRQNHCRELVGLKPRTPASFNLFFDESIILPHLQSCGLKLIDTEDFGSLHDLMLYVLVPAINGGETDYGHPLVEAATRLSKQISAENPSAFGQFGQNRLYACMKM